MNYKGKGIRFERIVRKYLEDKGFFVVRQASSKFPDIIAIDKVNVYFIECKTNKYISKEEKQKLNELYQLGIPLIAYPEKSMEDVHFCNLKYREVKL